MAQKGNNIIVLRNGTAIAGVKSDEIQSGTDTIEVASATQQQWKEFIAGRKEWSLNTSYLLLAAGSLGDLIQTGNVYELAVTDRQGNVSVSGHAILTVCKQTHTRGNLCQGTFQFRGTGPLVLSNGAASS